MLAGDRWAPQGDQWEPRGLHDRPRGDYERRGERPRGGSTWESEHERNRSGNIDFAEEFPGFLGSKQQVCSHHAFDMGRRLSALLCRASLLCRDHVHAVKQCAMCSVQPVSCAAQMGLCRHHC